MFMDDVDGDARNRNNNVPDDANMNNNNHDGDDEHDNVMREENEDDIDMINANNNNELDENAFIAEHLRRQRGREVDNNNNNNRYNAMLLKKPSFVFRNYTALSLFCFVSLLWYAFRSHSSQFYPSILFLTSSKLSYIVIGNAVASLSLSFFHGLTRFFLGGLRDLERESISDNMRWGLTETCLALTMFRQEMTVKMTAMFLTLVLSKGLHWALEMRGKHMGQTEELFDVDYYHDNNVNVNPNNPRRQKHKIRVKVSHLKFIILGYLLYIGDLIGVYYCANETAQFGPSVNILFGFEAAVLSVSASTSLGLYYLHALDSLMQLLLTLYQETDDTSHTEDASNTENNSNTTENNSTNTNNNNNTTNANTNHPKKHHNTRKTIERFSSMWKERRGTYTLSLDLLSQAAKFLCYLLFFAIVFTYYGMPINIFRELYISFLELRRKVAAFMSFWKLSRDLDEKFETVYLDGRDRRETTSTATEGEDGTDNNNNTTEGNNSNDDDEEQDTCIICRDTMYVGKKLPGCGHVFHAYCLKGWLMQQQTCPTCRSDISAAAARVAAVKAAQVRQQEEEDGANGTNAATAAAVNVEDAATTAEQSTGNDTRKDGGTTARVTASPNSSSSSSSSRPRSSLLLRKRSSGSSITNNANPAMSVSAGAAASTNNNNKRRTATTVSFPCLYRVTCFFGTNVYSHGTTSTAAIERVRTVSDGVIIVCTERMWWQAATASSEKSEERFCDYGSEGNFMLKMPDGWVREQDVTKLVEVPVAAMPSGRN